MSKIKKIATLSFGQGINIIVNFLFLPYMARVLPYEDYGTYGQVLLIGTFIYALFSCGLSQIIYVYLNKKGKEGEVLYVNTLAGISLGLLAALIIFFSSEFFTLWLKNPELKNPLRFYAIAPLFLLPFGSINAYLIFKGKVKKSVAISIISNLVKVLLVVFIIQNYMSISLALLAIAFSYVVQFSLGLYHVRHEMDFTFSKSLFLEQISKGFPLGLTGILGTGILYIDGFMVSKFLGVEAFAIYRNGALEVPYLATVYASIAAIILPEVAKLYSKKKFEEIVNLKRKVITNTMMITYPVLIFLIFNASDLIITYLGDKYQESAIIFAVFNLTLIIRVNSYHDIIVAANKGKILLNYYLLVFILNIALNLILINYLDILGAAIATVLSLFIFAYLLLKKSMNLINSSILRAIDVKAFLGLIVICIPLAAILAVCKSFMGSKLYGLAFSAVIFFSLSYFLLLRFNFFTEGIKDRILMKLKIVKNKFS